MKRILISEDERTRILGMHFNNGYNTLLNEQVQTQPQQKSLQSKKISLSRNFPSGKYLIKNSEELTPYLTQVQDFLKTVPQNQKTNITISAGESLVPNRDGEKPDKPIMKQGELAKNRMNEVERVVKEKFGQLPNVTVTKSEPKIGTTPWDPKKGPDFSAYTQEQFVDLILTASGSAPSPGKVTPACKQYDFYFGNRVFRTLDKTKATQFLNALANNPQGQLTPNCVNFVGNTYHTVTPSTDNEFKSHFPQTIGFVGQDDIIYKSRELYDKDSYNNAWINPIKSYGMVSV